MLPLNVNMLRIRTTLKKIKLGYFETKIKSIKYTNYEKLYLATCCLKKYNAYHVAKKKKT